MYENLLVFAQQANAAVSSDGSALPEALRISVIAMAAIFFVMGLFGSMIALLSRLFPENNNEQH